MSKKSKHMFRHATSAPTMSNAAPLYSGMRPYPTAQIGSRLIQTPSEIPMQSQMKGNLVFRGWMKKKSDWWGKMNPRFVTLSDDGLLEWSAGDTKDSKERIVHGSFFLKDYKFRMESSADTHMYRFRFISKSQNVEKKSSVYEFQPNSQADAHGWSNAISNVMSRIRTSSFNADSDKRKSTMKKKPGDICRKKGLILCQDGEISCPIKRSLKSLIMRQSTTYKTVAMEFEVVRGVLLVYDIGAMKPLRRVLLKDAKVVSVKPPAEHATEEPYWFQIKLVSAETGKQDRSLTIGMRDRIEAGHLRTLITLACVSSAEFLGMSQLKNVVAIGSGATAQVYVVFKNVSRE